jgi:peptidoglycan/xylan/chitin deacetylase (PgdA/CDA1 family)
LEGTRVKPPPRQPVRVIKRLANRARDLLFLGPFDGFWRRGLLGKVLCVVYHRVDRRGAVPFLDRFGAPPITREELSEELEILKARGARFMTFADLRRGEFPGESEFGVIVSFDDGFGDNYTNGLELLASMGIRATMFQSTAMVDAETLVWEHALYWYWHHEPLRSLLSELFYLRFPSSQPPSGKELLEFLRDKLPMQDVRLLLADMLVRSGAGAQLSQQARAIYPSSVDLVRAQSAGHELASHGHNHYHRSTIDEAAFEHELTQSVDALTRIAGEAPAAFAYPFNDYLAGDMAIAGRHFQQVATVDGALIDRRSPPLALPRFTWPGPHRNALRRKRWLWTGRT